MDDQVAKFGNSITKLAAEQLCASRAKVLFKRAKTEAIKTRDATTLVDKLSNEVSARIQKRFEQVKSLAMKFEDLLENSPTPTSQSLVPCCEMGSCENCHYHDLFSKSIKVDLQNGCLRYPAVVSASAPDGRNDIPANESAGQLRNGTTPLHRQDLIRVFRWSLARIYSHHVRHRSFAVTLTLPRSTSPSGSAGGDRSHGPKRPQLEMVVCWHKIRCIRRWTAKTPGAKSVPDL